MKVTVKEMLRMYPKRSGTAVTGWIPMHVFDAVEQDLRPEMRARGYRVIYRGPRIHPQQSMTRRRDATHAVVYRSN